MNYRWLNDGSPSGPLFVNGSLAMHADCCCDPIDPPGPPCNGCEDCTPSVAIVTFSGVQVCDICQDVFSDQGQFELAQIVDTATVEAALNATLVLALQTPASPQATCDYRYEDRTAGRVRWYPTGTDCGGQHTYETNVFLLVRLSILGVPGIFGAGDQQQYFLEADISFEHPTFPGEYRGGGQLFWWGATGFVADDDLICSGDIVPATSNGFTDVGRCGLLGGPVGSDVQYGYGGQASIAMGTCVPS